MEYQELIANVKQWAEDRELIDQANVRQQAMKVVKKSVNCVRESIRISRCKCWTAWEMCKSH